MRHRADPVRVRSDKGRAAAQEVAGLVELLVHQLRIEALHDDIDGLRIGVAVLVVH